MAVLRPHLALTVESVERALPFYKALFGVEPTKVRPAYAKFEVADPGLNFTLNEGERDGALGAFNHAGIQVDSTDEVLRTRARLVEAGLATFDEMDTTCCYAKQDKFWVKGAPNGESWEIYTVLADSPTPNGEADGQECCTSLLVEPSPAHEAATAPSRCC